MRSRSGYATASSRSGSRREHDKVAEQMTDEHTQSEETTNVPTGDAPGVNVAEITVRQSTDRVGAREAIFELENVNVAYGTKPAVRDISFDVGKHEITALIGPSGCGKSTLLRCLNRMNDLIPGAAVSGTIKYHGQ